MRGENGNFLSSWFCGAWIGSENEVNDDGAIGAWGTRVVKDGGVCLVKIFELVFLRDKSKNLARLNLEQQVLVSGGV